MMPKTTALAGIPVVGVLHALDEPAWLMSLNGQECLYNQKLIDTFPVVLEGREAKAACLHPQDISSLTAEFQQGLAAKQKFSLRYRYKVVEDYRWIETTLTPVQVEGEPIAWLGKIRIPDPTALLHEALVQSAPVRMSVFDQAYYLKLVNARVLESGRHTLAEYQGSSYSELEPELFEQVKPYLDQVLQTGETVNVELQVPLSDEEIWWQITYFPVKTSDGQLIGVGGISQNITRTRRDMQALEDHLGFLQKVTDGIHATISLTDLKTGKSIFRNQFSADLMGYTLSEIDAMTPEEGWSHFLLEDHPHLQETAARIRTLGLDETVEQEYRLKHRNGHLIWLWGKNTIFALDEQGLPHISMGTAVDITERKKAELQLQESQRQLQLLSEAQKRFVSEASHEIKTPLMGIQGHLELLLRYQDITEEEKQEILQDCHKETLRLGRLVTDLLGLARGSNVSLTLEAEVRLNHLPLDILRTFESSKGNHHLVLGEVQDCMVLGDPDRLKQLLVILTANALKYTPDGGTITLSLTCTDSWAEMRVADTGIGIHEADLEKVFDRFYRSDHSQLGVDPGGSGLGLSIAKSIVEEHGGKIHLHSQLRIGTTVTISLPLLNQETP